jgi:acetyl-CoA carboxylase biotin carboxyl carrier protein
VDLKDIKAIIDLVKKNSVSEFELETPEFKIKIKRGQNGTVGTAYDEQASSGMVTYPPPAIPVSVSAPAQQTPPAPPPSNELDIKSPMIGTFYRAPSPESVAYVEIGTEVQPDTVVCIIEAMKVMNEIKAEAKGVITQVLVENAKPVEFGQPLFKIKPA